MRILGVDPGLTRVGVGVVDVARDRRATLVHVGVIRTSPELVLERRILAIAEGIRAALDEHAPDVVALERVFAQHNVRTVMGVAQTSGVVLHLAAERGLSVALHTPSEVKAAVTGYGAADKRQVGTMVARVLALESVPKPADAADALALAICHGWSGASASTPVAGSGALTSAQRAWHDAERATRSVALRRVVP